MRPKRETTRSNNSTYFVSTQTVERRPFFRHERWARLMLATLLHYGETDFILHAYVIMPDHLHLLVTPGSTIEKAMQLIKGGFSFRAKRELEWNWDVWQRGFTDHRLRDIDDWNRHLEYIRHNPVDARLVEDSALYEFIGFPNAAFPQGLKPLVPDLNDVRAKARTLHAEAHATRAEARPAFDNDEPRSSEAGARSAPPSASRGVTASESCGMAETAPVQSNFASRMKPPAVQGRNFCPPR